MKGLLAIEWLKMKSYRTFWVLIGFFAVLLPFWNYGISKGILKIGGGQVNVLNQVYSFSYIWENIGFWASIFVLFISILIIILTTNEYQFRTNRQNVIDGWSRLDFYHAKWQVVIALALATTAYVFVVGFLFAVVNGSFNGFPGHIEKLLYVMILSLNYYAFSLVLSIFMKRSGLGIGMFILYCLIIETLLKFMLNHAVDNVGNFLPLQASDELLPFPVFDMLKSIAQMNSAPSPLPYVIASCIWIVIYYFIGKARLLRSDW